jgi:hypothetical protein
VRPIAPRGLHQGEQEVLWMRGPYGRYQRFRSSIVLLLAGRSAPPAASFSASLAARRTVALERSMTLAPGQFALWQLGDGTTATGRRVVHRYSGPGHYFPRLEVWDTAGRRAVHVHELELR